MLKISKKYVYLGLLDIPKKCPSSPVLNHFGATNLLKSAEETPLIYLSLD